MDWKWGILVGVTLLIIGKAWVLTAPLDGEVVINSGLATVVLSCLARLFSLAKRDKKPKEREILGIYHDPSGHKCVLYAPTTPTEKFLHWLKEYLP